eukprot:105695-Chlamydomonas_euryale.AAC.1
MLRAQKRATSGPPWPSKHAKRLTRPACSAPPSPTPSTSPAVSADRSASTPGAPTLGVSTPGAPRLGMLCAGSSAPGLLDSCVPPRCRACAPLRPSMLHSASTARSTVCAPSCGVEGGGRWVTTTREMAAAPAPATVVHGATAATGHATAATRHATAATGHATAATRHATAATRHATANSL